MHMSQYMPLLVAFQNFQRILNSKTRLAPRVLIWDNGPILTYVFSFLEIGKGKEVNAAVLGERNSKSSHKYSKMVILLSPNEGAPW